MISHLKHSILTVHFVILILYFTISVLLLFSYTLLYMIFKSKSSYTFMTTYFFWKHSYSSSFNK